MTDSELKKGYAARLPLFQKATTKIVEDLKHFLNGQNIHFLTVDGRVKSLESFVEKVERKKYSDPFIQNEDFCGIRIITYYPKDISKVEEIVDGEFDVQETIDKERDLNVNEFGYRSEHKIVKLRPSWLSAPTYRGLGEIKLEIQIRTILMHAWAELEHQLVYKKKDQIPRDLERSLFRVCAKLEEADNQFQDLKEGIENYRDAIKLSLAAKGSVETEVTLNYDSLTALLDYYLPDSPKNQRQAISLLERLKEEKISLTRAEEMLKFIQPKVDDLNKEVFLDKKLRLTQATLLSYADDILNSYDKYSVHSEKRKKIVEKYRAQIGSLS
jgi:ppGpp synthetase/RelA/SpoT-type nucleotidyltranferase